MSPTGPMAGAARPCPPFPGPVLPPPSPPPAEPWACPTRPALPRAAPAASRFDASGRAPPCSDSRRGGGGWRGPRWVTPSPRPARSRRGVPAPHGPGAMGGRVGREPGAAAAGAGPAGRGRHGTARHGAAAPGPCRQSPAARGQGPAARGQSPGGTRGAGRARRGPVSPGGRQMWGKRVGPRSRSAARRHRRTPSEHSDSAPRNGDYGSAASPKGSRPPTPCVSTIAPTTRT